MIALVWDQPGVSTTICRLKFSQIWVSTIIYMCIKNMKIVKMCT